LGSSPSGKDINELFIKGAFMEEPRIEGIEEVVIAVKDADRSVAYFEDIFGMAFPFCWGIPGEKVRVRSARISETQLQFIESTDADGVVAKFIREKGEGLNHIAFRVTNLKEMVKRLKEKGVKLIPEEIVTVENSDIPFRSGKAEYIFIHPKSACGVLIELVEAK
jgi:methylmalonyl-CoA/ethylmalonyl-CoA epimerase